MANIGDTVRLVYNYGPDSYLPIFGIIDRYIENDLDGGGYWVVDSLGEEWEVLFHDLFRGDAILEVIEGKD